MANITLGLSVCGHDICKERRAHGEHHVRVVGVWQQELGK